MTPRRFYSLCTRNLLGDMLVASYAHARNIDLNEAALRLADALRDARLLGGLQESTWRALAQKKPNLDDASLLDVVAKKLEKPRRYKAIQAKGADDGRAAAVLVLVDVASGVATGDARDMLESELGSKYLHEGFDVFGRHLAAELLR